MGFKTKGNSVVLEETTTTPPETENSRPQLQHHSDSVAPGLSPSAARQKIEEENVRGIIFPWSKWYRTWWSLTVIGAIATIFTETFAIAFLPGGITHDDTGATVTEFVLLAIFVVDLVVTFFVAYRDQKDDLVYDRKLIANHYLRNMFWIDVLGVFPFYAFALACAGQIGQDNTLTQYLALLRLIKLVRLQRVKLLFDVLQFTTKVSLTLMTLVRNISAAMIWSHFSACVLYFIARQYKFDPDNTWIGSVDGMSISQRYVTSLYWSIVSFATVGYGDYSPVNVAEMIWGILYLLLNLIILAWIIGSMTLLIVKQDAKTGLYQNTMKTLQRYATVNGLNSAMRGGLKTQLKLEFKNRELADEHVLKFFPIAVRRKVLRTLYLSKLVQTSLMQNARQQFVDSFLTNCSVEMFSPGEELLECGANCEYLYLLIEGVITLVQTSDASLRLVNANGDDASSNADSTRVFSIGRGIDVMAGDFLNEVSFFTGAPQTYTIRSKTICKTLSMSKKAYDLISNDHPASVGKILNNLLTKIEKLGGRGDDSTSSHKLTRTDSTLFFSMDSNLSYYVDVQRAASDVQLDTQLCAIRDLIKSHKEKQKDDNTTRFLFVAARGDISMLAFLIDQGFDPNSADYDSRTALMVASMKGNTEVVRFLCNNGVDLNCTDVHGTTALQEAIRNCHDSTFDVLLDHGAKLGMKEADVAPTLCNAVQRNDLSALKQLLKAGIPVNATDYDQRAAIHIAAAEGNVAAMKLLVEYGADLTVEDRWGNTLTDDARRSNSDAALAYLATLSETLPIDEEMRNVVSDEEQLSNLTEVIDFVGDEMQPSNSPDVAGSALTSENSDN